jgi:uncharacterized protein (TIGR02271 family)
MPGTIESVTWSSITGKGARGITDKSYFGEVQEVGQHYVVLTQKEAGSKEKFFIPKYLVRGFDGSTVWFDASLDQLQAWKRSSPPDSNEYSRYNAQQSPSDIETRIPIIEDPLCMSERESTFNSATKESANMIKTLNSPVKQEELIVERRPASGLSSATPENPVESETGVKVRPSSEEIGVVKEPYVREGMEVTKKLSMETRTEENSATSKKEFNTSAIKKEEEEEEEDNANKT